jgi:hypothetical protein
MYSGIDYTSKTPEAISSSPKIAKKEKPNTNCPVARYPSKNSKPC